MSENIDNKTIVRLTDATRKKVSRLLEVRYDADQKVKAAEELKKSATDDLKAILKDNSGIIAGIEAPMDDKGNNRMWKWEATPGETKTIKEDQLRAALIMAGVKPKVIDDVIAASTQVSKYVKYGVRAVIAG